MTPDNAVPVGLVPAAGRASRLGALPCSKEVFPVAFEAGRARLIIPFALNDQPGRWELRASDVASGVTADLVVALGPE